MCIQVHDDHLHHIDARRSVSPAPDMPPFGV
jgi:hypothetical protein